MTGYPSSCNNFIHGLYKLFNFLISRSTMYVGISVDLACMHAFVLFCLIFLWGHLSLSNECQFRQGDPPSSQLASKGRLWSLISYIMYFSSTSGLQIRLFYVHHFLFLYAQCREGIGKSWGVSSGQLPWRSRGRAGWGDGKGPRSWKGDLA